MDEYKGKVIKKTTYMKYMLRYGLPITHVIDGIELTKGTRQLQYELYKYESDNWPSIIRGLYFCNEKQIHSK